MLIDKKGRLFGKINIIDLCIILLIVSAVAVTLIKFNAAGNGGNTEKNTEIVYTLKVASVRDYTVNQFVEGDNLYDDETGKYIGKIVSVEKKPDMVYVVKADGTYAISEKPERYDAYITVSANGSINEKGYFAEGIRQISNHSTVVISNKRFKTTSTVDSVAKK